ncbi:MAG: hypothetical protein IKO05_01080 [Selenomonadaceae bacterium]|nr:hypothetical protein [Selenomonadaceae bacterium]
MSAYDNDKSNVKITGSLEADSIKNSGDNVIINALDGKDTINNSGNSVTILGGDAKDTVKNSGENVSVNGGTSGDSIRNEAAGINSTLDGDWGDDTIDNLASSVTIIGGLGNDNFDNDGAQVSLFGGDGADTIDNEGNSSTLLGGAGNDSIQNGGASVSVDGGDDNDYIRNGGAGSKVTLDGGAGNDRIDNHSKKVTINSGAGNDYIYNDGDSVTVNGGAGHDTINNAGERNVKINGGAGNDSIYNYYGSESVTLNGGAGNDAIINTDDNVSIEGGEGADYIRNGGYYDEDGDWWDEDGSNVTISGGDGSDTIESGSGNVSIDGGDGDDLITSDGKEVSIEGGAGDDLITSKGDDCTLAGGAGNDLITSTGDEILFKYAPGDGDDTIDGFNAYSRIRIGDGTDTYSKETVGDDILISVGEGSVLLLGAAKLSEVYISGIEEQAGSSWTLNGTTATYGSLTVKGVTSTDGLSIKGKVVVISEASLGTGKVSITGDGYTLALADDVARTSTSKAWSLSKTTASYKQTTKAGYTLADNAKSITYSKKSVTTLVKVKGVTSLDGLKLSGTTVTVSEASLGTNDVTISDGYALKLGSDVESSSSKKSWSFSKSTATYKQTTTEGYSLVDNEIIYSAAATKTLASVKGATTKSGLKVSGSTIKLPASALSSKVTVSGAYTFDFASDYSKATITGSSSDDTIIARGKNILVKGGKGSDVFALKSTVANTINDYEEADKVSLLSGAAEISVNGDDVIFNGKVTLKGAIDKAVTYIEDGEEKVFKYTPAAVKFNAKGTSITLLETYAEDSFDIADFSEYKNTVVTIKASAVQHSLEIFGNKNANKIFGTNEDDYIDGQAGADTISGGKGKDTLVGGKGNDSLNGGAGNDSLWGGAGDDTLFGGAGKDIFVYHDGEGTDVIEDFDASLDKIRVLSGDVSTPTVDSSGDVTFAVGDGEIVVKGGADKYIPVYDSGKNILMKYNPR